MAVIIEKICRTCLGLNKPLHSIYDGDSGGGLCIADMLRVFTRTKPRQGDKLPEGVCSACISDIKRCYSFKLKCENSCSKLRQLVFDSPDEESSEPQKNKAVQYGKSAQTQSKYTKQLKAVCTQTKVILEPERNQQIRKIASLLFDETQSQNYDEIELETCLDEEEIEISATAAAGNIQVLNLKDFDVSNEEAELVMQFEAEDEEMNENIPGSIVYSSELEQEESNENSITDQVTDTEQQSENESENDSTTNIENNLIDFEVNTDREDNEAERDEVLHFCESCGAGFVLQRTLELHKKQDVCNKVNFKCNKCDRVFISLETYNEHNAVHGLDYECTECGLSLQTSHKLARHMIKVHKKDPRNQCPICKKVFAYRTKLKDHIRMHSGEKPFMCPICKKYFAHKTYLKLHIMRHSNEKRYKCPDCEKSFVTRGEFCIHQRSHTGEYPFQCDECQASFARADTLAKHKLRHTGERTYKCNLCPRNYTSSVGLENHQHVHIDDTDEMPYKCGWCSETFSQKKYCISHELTHMDKQSYDCFCGKKFGYLDALHEHMKSHENTKDDALQKSLGYIVRLW